MFATDRARVRRLFTLARVASTFFAGFRFNRFAIPFGIAEMVVRLHKIINREVVLAVIKPCTAPDDLFELYHRINGAHQNDVADIAGIDAG